MAITYMTDFGPVTLTEVELDGSTATVTEVGTDLFTLFPTVPQEGAEQHYTAAFTGGAALECAVYGTIEMGLSLRDRLGNPVNSQNGATPGNPNFHCYLYCDTEKNYCQLGVVTIGIQTWQEEYVGRVTRKTDTCGSYAFNLVFGGEPSLQRRNSRDFLMGVSVGRAMKGVTVTERTENPVFFSGWTVRRFAQAEVSDLVPVSGEFGTA